jgi:uncharacterized protein YutE (UPF0331/DUF86 family)
VSPVDRDILRSKIAIMVRNLKALEEISERTAEEYERDLFLRKATERLLQELIEAAIDINTHVIVQSGGLVPDSYYEGFLELGTLKIIPTNLAAALAPSAGLRNRLVHEYDRIDDSIVRAAAAEAATLYTDYVRAIQQHIETAE